MVPDIKDTWYFYSFAKQPTYIDGTTPKMIAVLTIKDKISNKSQNKENVNFPQFVKRQKKRGRADNRAESWSRLAAAFPVLRTVNSTSSQFPVPGVGLSGKASDSNAFPLSLAFIVELNR